MLPPDMPAEDAVQLCLNFNVRKAARVITQFYNQALQPIGLLSTQFSVLVALTFGGELSISELAGILVTDRTTLARNLAPLERQGYLQIARGEADRRRKVVRITPQGARVLEKALPLWAAAQEKIQAELGGDALRQLKGDITALVTALQT